MNVATFKDFSQLRQVMELGDGIPFALEVLENEKRSIPSFDGGCIDGHVVFIINTCDALAISCLKRTPDMIFLKRACDEILNINNNFSHCDRSVGFAQVASLLVTEITIRHVRKILHQNRCERERYDLPHKKGDPEDAVKNAMEEARSDPDKKVADLVKKWRHIAEPRYGELVKKWQHIVAPTWYGFDLSGCPVAWYDAIDQINEFITAIDSSFQLLQVKLKFGGCRWYTESKAIMIPYVQQLIESALYDPKLVW